MICKSEKPLLVRYKAGHKVEVINQGKKDALNFYVSLVLARKHERLIRKGTPYLFFPKNLVFGKRKIPRLKAGESLFINFPFFKIPYKVSCNQWNFYFKGNSILYLVILTSPSSSSRTR